MQITNEALKAEGGKPVVQIDTRVMSGQFHEMMNTSEYTMIRARLREALFPL